MSRTVLALTALALLLGCASSPRFPGSPLSRPSTPDSAAPEGMTEIRPRVPAEDAGVEPPDGAAEAGGGLEDERPAVDIADGDGFEEVALAAERRVTPERAQRLLAGVPEGDRKLLTIDGEPFVLLADLDGDGRTEAFALALGGQEEATDISQLSDYGRLFDSSIAPRRYFLNVYGAAYDSLRLRSSTDLGAWQVFGSVSARSLSSSSHSPVVIMCEFQTAAATEHRWILPDQGGRSPRMVLQLTQTVSVEPSVRDIDGDGYLDVVTREQVLESGGRYETYLTWWGWNGHTYVETATTTVVRNLLDFLAHLRRLIFQGDAAAVVEFAVDRQAARQLRDEEGMSDEGMILRVLGMGGDEEVPVNPLDGVRDIVFPEIRESPFTESDSRGSPFDLTLRIIDSQGNASFARARLYLYRNPFAQDQFAFFPPEVR